MGEFFDDCVESFDETKAEIDVKFSQLEGMVDWREKLGILEDLEGEIDGAEEEIKEMRMAAYQQGAGKDAAMGKVKECEKVIRDWRIRKKGIKTSNDREVMVHGSQSEKARAGLDMLNDGADMLSSGVGMLNDALDDAEATEVELENQRITILAANQKVDNTKASLGMANRLVNQMNTRDGLNKCKIGLCVTLGIVIMGFTAIWCFFIDPKGGRTPFDPPAPAPAPGVATTAAPGTATAGSARASPAGLPLLLLLAALSQWASSPRSQ